MSKIVDKPLHTAKIILEILASAPLRCTDLEKLTVQRSPSHVRFRSALDWLLQKEYMKKTGRGVYAITDKGRELLKIIK